MKLVKILLLFVSCFGAVFPSFVGEKKVCAQTVENVYSIYSETGELLLQKQDVFIGDSFLTKDFNKYEIIYIDEMNKIGKAKFLEKVKKPNINNTFALRNISEVNPVICLYMTHNDESYLPTDGVDSVYGEGGIHDVAKSLQTHFQLKGVKTYLDETLHIPHDTLAYSRSSGTAKSLINKYSPDGIFDIHRDGASRKTYVKTVNGSEKCKIRIVVGKASKNYAVAEQFALYLLTVAEEICDWLFLDIYYATGHYNQGLHEKALLFEMGSHLVEKELVLKSVEPLVNVITTAMFQTTVSDSGELTINGEVTEDTPLVNDALTEVAKNNQENGIPVALSVIIAGSVLVLLTTLTFKKMKK